MYLLRLMLIVVVAPGFFGVSHAHAASLININTASVAQLDTLPGIGPSKAEAIVEYRQQHGPFLKAEDIQNVSGIGPVTFSKLSMRITVTDTTEMPAAPAPVAKPGVVSASYSKTPEVEKVVTHNILPDDHSDAVVAPAAAPQTASAGAAHVPGAMPSVHTPLTFFSPWTFGLFAVVLVAGGAFILL